MKSIRDYSWEEAEDTSEERKKKRISWEFLYASEEKQRPSSLWVSRERRWRTKSPAPSPTSSLSMRLPARCWWGTGGWEWCAGSSSWGSWFTSSGKTCTLFLFLFLAVRKWWERVCITLCSSSCLELPSWVTQSSLCVDRVGGSERKMLGLCRDTYRHCSYCWHSKQAQMTVVRVAMIDCKKKVWTWHNRAELLPMSCLDKTPAAYLFVYSASHHPP